MKFFTATTAILLLFVCSVLPIFASADDDDDSYVTCGSVVKIQHVDTKYYLNSENKNLNIGSGQQFVSFVKSPSSHHTLWWIRPANDMINYEYEYHPDTSTCQLAEPIKCDSIVRFTHLETKRNLHSHEVKSVLSKQQEVTGFGEGDSKGDNGDNWRVQCTGKSNREWKRNTPVRLQHVDTGRYLGTSAKLEFNAETCGSGCPIMNHLEAFGRSTADSHTFVKVEQGIHLSI